MENLGDQHSARKYANTAVAVALTAAAGGALAVKQRRNRENKKNDKSCRQVVLDNNHLIVYEERYREEGVAYEIQPKTRQCSRTAYFEQAREILHSSTFRKSADRQNAQPLFNYGSFYILTDHVIARFCRNAGVAVIMVTDFGVGAIEAKGKPLVVLRRWTNHIAALIVPVKGVARAVGLYDEYENEIAKLEAIASRAVGRRVRSTPLSVDDDACDPDMLERNMYCSDRVVWAVVEWAANGFKLPADKHGSVKMDLINFQEFVFATAKNAHIVVKLRNPINPNVDTTTWPAFIMYILRTVNVSPRTDIVTHGGPTGKNRTFTAEDTHWLCETREILKTQDAAQYRQLLDMTSSLKEIMLYVDDNYILNSVMFGADGKSIDVDTTCPIMARFVDLCDPSQGP